MKHVSLTFILLLAFIRLMPQSNNEASGLSNEHDLHRLVQFTGTSEALRDLFKNEGINSNSDYLITVILPPMGCPRCEGLIAPFLNDIKDLDSAQSTAVFAFYPKPKPLFNYLKERQFPADDIYIFTNEKILNNFYLSSNGLQVPFFAKFRISTGELILSKSTLGMDYTRETAVSFIKASNPLGKIKRQDSIDIKNSYAPFDMDSLTKSGNNYLDNYEISIVKDSENFALSQISRAFFSGDGKKISFMDDLTNSICVYEKKENDFELMRNIRAGEFENRLFFSDELGESMYQFLKKMNVLNSMYFNSGLYGDTVIISASLPQVYYEDKEAERIAYFNKIVFLKENLKTANSRTFSEIDTSLQFLILNHIEARYFPKQNKIFIPLSKGWPDSGHGSEPEDTALENPFREDFYHYTPAFAILICRENSLVSRDLLILFIPFTKQGIPFSHQK
jgi:hypothetical protein